jgi:hypothetical protein
MEISHLKILIEDRKVAIGNRAFDELSGPPVIRSNPLKDFLNHLVIFLLDIDVVDSQVDRIFIRSEGLQLLKHLIG